MTTSREMMMAMTSARLRSSARRSPSRAFFEFFREIKMSKIKPELRIGYKNESKPKASKQSTIKSARTNSGITRN